MAQHSADTLLRVINDILDFSKIEAGKLDLHLTAVDLHEVLHQSATAVAERATTKGLLFECSIDPDVPRGVETDGGRLAQVLGNLLDNAVKFTESGGVTLRVVRAAVGAEHTRVRFAVTDTGPGLGPEQQQRLFKPFSQVQDAATRRSGGSGLGLGICKHLVEMIGGSIGVTSEAGKGSTFWFDIPFRLRNVGPASRDDVVAESGPGAPVPVDGNLAGGGAVGGRVLLAEDNEINQELAWEMIRMTGCDCECVGNGHDAIRAAASGRYAMVFMDCMMPGMDGYHAVRAIRAAETEAAAPGGVAKRLPIVAMTANALEGDREDCLAAGMDDYLSKPLDPDEVVAMIRKWLVVRPLEASTPCSGMATEGRPGEAVDPDSDPGL